MSNIVFVNHYFYINIFMFVKDANLFQCTKIKCFIIYLLIKDNIRIGWWNLHFNSFSLTNNVYFWRIYIKSTGRHRLPAEGGNLPSVNTESFDGRNSSPKSNEY